MQQAGPHGKFLDCTMSGSYFLSAAASSAKARSRRYLEPLRYITLTCNSGNPVLDSSQDAATSQRARGLQYLTKALMGSSNVGKVWPLSVQVTLPLDSALK